MAHASVPLHLTHSPTASDPSPPSFSPTMDSSPSTTGTSPAKATHTCPSCSRSFSRGEHLDRHLTTHMPSAASKAFVCQSCSKGFTRKDVLTRHIRAVHETKRPDVRKSRRRSCRRCAGFKIKCSGGGRGAGKNGARQVGRAEDPCEACKKRGAVCIYDFGNSVEETEGSPKDDMLEFGSEASEEGTEVRGSKRRRVGERYESAFDGEIRRVSPHLLSAARIASESGNQDLRSGSSGSAASLSNLISGDQAPELASADHIMSLMTTNTYGIIPNLDGSRPSSGSQTPQKAPAPADMPVFGMKPQQQTRSPSIQPAIAPSSPGTLMYRRDDYFQAQKPSASANKRPEPLPLSPRDFRDNLSTLTKTLQGFPPLSPPSRSPQRHFSNVQAPKSIDISSFVNDVQEESQRPRDYPPVSFTVDYTQMNQKQGEIQQNDRNLEAGNLGSLVGHQGMTGNIDVSQLGVSTPEDNNSSYINDLPDLENDDNWFFDFGIFDTTTDWLRGWGDDSSAQDPTGINGTLPEHLSTVAPPPAGTTAPGRAPSPVLPLTSKPFVSPARPGSACSDEGSTMHCHKHRDAHQTRLPSVNPIKDLSSAPVEDFLPWGWQSGREEPKRRVTLPPLRQILEEYTPSASSQRTVAPAKKDGLLSEEIRDDMIELLSIPYERYPYERADMNRFPTRKLLDGFLTLYFEQFHSNLPMIHRPTFSVATCPTIVLVSMASIGASYSELEGAKVFADTLSELCKRTLTWMAEYNPEYPRSDFFLKALCLQSVYALGSGSHRLYDSADVSRSFLIGNARRIGLFSGTISPPASSPSSAPNSPGQSNAEDTPLPRDINEPLPLEVRWNTWRKQEELKRLAWSIFEYDCSFSTLSNRRGAITLNDISTSMPCAEALWEAPNAQAWAALLEPKHSAQTSCAEKEKLFYPALRDVISEKMSPDNLTSWGKRLCAQAMGRILWDFKELEESVLSVGTSTGGLGNGGGLGLPMLSPGLKPAKETLLKSLMTLCESIQRKQIDTSIRESEVDGDRVHMVLACLISHYTHLHAAFPTISLILSLARRPPSSTESGVDPRITRLKTIFSTDPIYARTLAWNSAQIIAISRWKPVFSPVEGMRIFMAGVVLWGFGRYFREPTNTNSEDIRTSPDSPTIRGMQVQIVRLDSHPWTRGVKGTGEYCPDEWIKNGGKKATIGNDDPDGNAMTEVCSERGAKEVLKVVVGILGRMRVWGLGGEFKSVLEEMAKRS